MPLPIGHSLAGYSIYENQGLAFFRQRWQTLLFFVVLANLPDSDFLPGYLLGNPNLYHHNIAHSLGAAVVVGVLGAWYFSRAHGHFAAYFWVISGGFYSHLLLDYFNADTRVPLGVMLLWPLSQEHFIAPITLFKAVHKTSDSATFLHALFSSNNLVVVGRELLVMLPVAILARFISVYRRRRLRKLMLRRPREKALLVEKPLVFGAQLVREPKKSTSKSF